MSGLPEQLIHLATHDGALGLLPNTVRVVAPNPAWPKIFEGFAQLLEPALHELDTQVEHIGSTSVPGLAAKPVLDIAIGVAPPVPTEEFVERLEAVGFDYQLDLGMYGGLFFTADAEPGVVISNLHVVATDDFQWRWYQAFRDGLRDDDELRNDYQALKERSAASNATDREGYTKAKFDWVLAAVTDLDPGED